MIEIIQAPWPWYVAGPLLGLIVPLLLYFSNEQFGTSSSFRHLLCTLPLSRFPYFDYSWKAQSWNIVFMFGVSIGGFIAYHFIGVSDIELNPEMLPLLAKLGVTDLSGLLPSQIFKTIPNSVAGVVFTFGGGLLIGYGARWANGCTAGHTIMGISQLSKTSLIASICFFVGGIIASHFIIPFIATL